MGATNEDLATNCPFVYLLRFTLYVYAHLLGLLPWWSSQSREGCSLLHHFRCRLFHIFHRHVDCGAVILNESRNRGNGQDMWGWSCKDNTRKQLFQDDVSYALVCRLQNWSLICCIIEVVVEVIAIIIYGITFYRYYTKRRLRKTMAARDRARSDLYLAQLKLQSAPNTPGLPGGLLSPRDGGWQPPQGFEHYNTDRKTEMGESGTQFATVSKKPTATVKPFTLQAPPPKKSKLDNGPASPAIVNDHVPAASGETQYAAVAIPGAYAAPASPAYASNAGFDFGIDSRINNSR